MKLTAIDSIELNLNKDNLDNRCVMCRKELNDETRSKEHIYPKWLLRKYDMYNKSLTLINESRIQYRHWIVPCCKKCNGEEMSELENKIKNAVVKF